ncbi:MAG: HD domain-containing protein [Bacillaceae bacterium]|nr:HD domain-containing protein [Bacillaceae bacterium]
MYLTDDQLDEEKVFKDPVHRYIHVRSRLIWDLINTREFQRLRRIRQLGTSFLTFHGAEHSRFNHSLGVYEIMRRILEKFEGRIEFSEEEKWLCLCAALLHDVGHGPFSHSFEKVFHTHHEDWTRRIILGDTGINQILSRVSPSFPDKVEKVIEKTYENKLIVSLISSQIDADRMDYLLRDTYYTGAHYGDFDMERILRVMRPYKDHVVIKYTGMHAVEDYIMSRYQMYWQVYFHPVTRSGDVLLRKIFQRARDLYRQGYQYQREPVHLIPFFEETEVPLQDYLNLDESVVIFYFHEWSQEQDPILSDLCDRFINRRLFKYVEWDRSRREELDQLKRLFREAGIDPDYYLEMDSPSDLPYDVYRPGQEERTPIFLLMADGSLEELSQASEIVDAISGKERYDHKLYFPLDFLEDPSRNPGTVQEIQKLLKYRSRNL